MHEKGKNIDPLSKLYYINLSTGRPCGFRPGRYEFSKGMPDENFSRFPNPGSGARSGKAFGRHLGFRALSCQLREGLHSPARIDLIQRFGFDIWHFGSDQHTLEQIYLLLEERIVPCGG
jgi:hypothetical protein